MKQIVWTLNMLQCPSNGYIHCCDATRRYDMSALCQMSAMIALMERGEN